VGAAASHLDLTVVDVRAHPLAEVLPFRFVEASVVELPFDDGAFDVVSAPQLLHHIGLTFGQVVRADAYQAGLGELIRVLRPGGRIVLCTWVKAGRSCVGPARPRIFGLAHLRHLLAERGLEVVDWHLVSRESCREIDEGQLRDATDLPADWALITLRKAP
jgi:SAM-dependent methyltransferase